MDNYRDLNELISIARNITEGRYDVVENGIDAKSEFYEIARFFSDSLKRIQSVHFEVDTQYGDIPIFEYVLDQVITESREHSHEVLTLVEKINFNIDELKEEFSTVKAEVSKGNFLKVEAILNRLSAKLISGEDICLDMIASLEFKESSISKVEESLSIVVSLEERLSSLLLSLGIKENIIDVDKIDNMKKNKEILSDQNLIDKLLEQFGV